MTVSPPELDPASIDDLGGLRVDGPVIGVMGCIAVALGDHFADVGAATSVGLDVYRRLCDAGYIVRQLGWVPHD